MIKLGITTMDQLRREARRSATGRVKQVAIPLLVELDKSADNDDLRERVLLELTDDRGAYKRTYKSRFDEFDMLVYKQIAAEFDTRQELRVLDCGISDGRTAIDFFCSLADEFHNLKFLGTDYDPCIRFRRRDKVTLVVSSRSQPMQLIRPPFVFNLRKRDRWLSYPINRVVLSYLSQRYLPAIMRDFTEYGGEEVSIYCPQALRLSEKDSRFKLGQQDILQPIVGCYHVIRIMNVLNPTYFETLEFVEIVKNVRAALAKGGLLIVGSNQDAGSKVEGAVYGLAESGFVPKVNVNLSAALNDIIVNVTDT